MGASPSVVSVDHAYLKKPSEFPVYRRDGKVLINYIWQLAITTVLGHKANPKVDNK